MAIAAPKKPSVPKKATSSSSHPPFAEMIMDAIVNLKERTGSSQYAIAKFIEEKHKQLPSNFRKRLLFYLKKSVAAGKLVKIKNSFKLPPTRSALAKPSAATAKKAKPAKAVSKPKAAVSKPRPKTAAKLKSAAKPKAVARSKTAAKPKVPVKPKAKPAAKVARASKKASPGKKAMVKKVKSPAKKAAARKA